MPVENSPNGNAPSQQALSAEGANAPLEVFEPTPEGLGAAIDATLARHHAAIQHLEPARGDQINLTGGDLLTLYPDPANPKEVITISPVGSTADARRFSETNEIHLNYHAKDKAGSGTYRIYGIAGTRRVQQWGPHPELANAIEVSNPEEAKFTGLIDALGRASTERPASRSRRAISALGRISRRGSNK